jgi:hypothetical protein
MVGDSIVCRLLRRSPEVAFLRGTGSSSGAVSSLLEPGFGPGRLEQFYRVARRVLGDGLLAADSGDDLVAEPDAVAAQPLDGAGGGPRPHQDGDGSATGQGGQNDGRQDQEQRENDHAHHRIGAFRRFVPPAHARSAAPDQPATPPAGKTSVMVVPHRQRRHAATQPPPGTHPATLAIA